MDNSYIVKQEYEPAALFDPYHLSLDDLDPLSSYYFSHQLGDAVQQSHDLPQSVVFGYTDHYHTASGNMPHDESAPAYDNNDQVPRTATSSLRYTVATPIHDAQQHSPQHVQVSDLSSSPIFGLNELGSRHQEQACDPRFVNNIREDVGNVGDATSTPPISAIRAPPASRAASSSGDDEYSRDDDTYCESAAARNHSVKAIGVKAAAPVLA